MLEAGIVHPKNSINILFKNMIVASLAALIFWALGYGFAYGDTAGGFIGASNFGIGTSQNAIRNGSASGPSGSDAWEMWFEAPQALAPFIAVKGSVCVDGVSLTVNRVEGARFMIGVIPHTLEVTTLGQRAVGDAVNIEVDQLARYVARILQYAQATDTSSATE